MYRNLKAGRRRGWRISRAVVLAGIAVLHAGALALALWPRITPPQIEPRQAMISVTLAPEPRPVRAPSPLAEPLEVVRIPILVPPEFTVNISDDRPPPTLAVAVEETAPVAAVAAATADTSAPPEWVSRVEYVRRPVQCYPSAALRARLEGSAHLRVLVDEEGRPQRVELSRSSGHAMLDAAAIQCVRAARFKPYVHNGVARAALVVVPIDFTLQRKG
jgi:periplasmic protein TonB